MLMPDALQFRTDERLEADEYIEFLSRSDLGTLYPRQRFRERVNRQLQTVDVLVTARDAGKLVGTCFGLTDFSFLLCVTDIGVDREYERRGIGKKMISLAHERAGGCDDICVIAWASKMAGPFYDECDMPPLPEARAKHARDWNEIDQSELMGHCVRQKRVAGDLTGNNTYRENTNGSSTD
jgi:GNAT superfamily N-acetyltransferase